MTVLAVPEGRRRRGLVGLLWRTRAGGRGAGGGSGRPESGSGHLGSGGGAGQRGGGAPGEGASWYVPGLWGMVARSLKPYWRRIALAVVVLLAALGATLAGPALVGWASNHGLVEHRSMRVIDIAGGAYVAVSALYFVLTRVQTLMVSGVGERYLNDLRKRVFSHLLAQPLGFFESESSGQLLSRMTADIDVLETLVQSGLSSFVTSIGLFISVMVILIVMSPLLWAVVVVSLVPALVAAARYRKRSTEAYGAVRELIGSALATLDESLAGVRVVQAFRQEEAKIERV